MKKLFISILFFSISIISFAGGGWPQPKGSGFFKIGQYILRSDRYFNPEGNIIDISPGVAFYATSLYAEYGITDRLTGIVYFPFFTRSVQNNLQKLDGTFVEGASLTGLGDTDITLKYGLIQNSPVVVSARLTLGLPLGEQTQRLANGDGEFNQMIAIDASRSFYPAPIYASAFVGFNNRTNDFSDEFRWGVEAGYTAGKFTFLARVNAIHSLKNGSPVISEQQGLFANNIEFISFTPEIIYSVKENYGFSLSVGGAFSGSQVLGSPAYEGGFFLKI